jgi:hypothetical protein
MRGSGAREVDIKRAEGKRGAGSATGVFKSEEGERESVVPW